MDTKEGYGDRLNAASYGNDVQCQLRLVPDSRDESSEPVEGWISERLLARLKHLGVAYELPLLKRLPDTGVQSYPENQVQDLEDELAFLFTVVSDDLLLKAVAPVREMIRVAMHDPRGWSLLVECP